MIESNDWSSITITNRVIYPVFSFGVVEEGLSCDTGRIYNYTHIIAYQVSLLYYNCVLKKFIINLALIFFSQLYLFK